MRPLFPSAGELMWLLVHSDLSPPSHSILPWPLHLFLTGQWPHVEARLVHLTPESCASTGLNSSLDYWKLLPISPRERQGSLLICLRRCMFLPFLKCLHVATSQVQETLWFFSPRPFVTDFTAVLVRSYLYVVKPMSLFEDSVCVDEIFKPVER